MQSWDQTRPDDPIEEHQGRLDKSALTDPTKESFRLSMLLYDSRHRSATIKFVALLGFMILVGLLNTVVLAALGCVAAAVLGVAIGVMCLSKKLTGFTPNGGLCGNIPQYSGAVVDCADDGNHDY